MHIGDNTQIKNKLFLTLIMASVVVFAEGAHAQSSNSSVDFSQHYTFKTVALGFGGAYRALADSASAMLVNPAGIAQHKGEVSFSGDYLQSGFANSKVYSLAVVDYKASDVVALGIEYDHDTFSMGNNVTVNQVTLAAGTSFGDMILVGANIKGFFSTVDSPLLDGPDGVDMDLGFIVKPLPMISLALTAQNLFLGSSHTEFPLQIGFGAALTLDSSARLAVDLVRDFETSNANNMNAYFGGELRMVEGVYARGGFGLDHINNNNFYSLGASVMGPKISLNFTFTERLNPSDETFAAGLELRF